MGGRRAEPDVALVAAFIAGVPLAGDGGPVVIGVDPWPSRRLKARIGPRPVGGQAITVQGAKPPVTRVLGPMVAGMAGVAKGPAPGGLAPGGVAAPNGRPRPGEGPMAVTHAALTSGIRRATVVRTRRAAAFFITPRGFEVASVAPEPAAGFAKPCLVTSGRPVGVAPSITLPKVGPDGRSAGLAPPMRKARGQEVVGVLWPPIMAGWASLAEAMPTQGGGGVRLSVDEDSAPTLTCRD